MPEDSGQIATQPPVSQPTYNSQPTPTSLTPKKSKKILLIIVSLVIVLVVAAGVFAYLLLVVQPKKDTASVKPADLSSLGAGFKKSINDPTDSSWLVYKSTNPASVIYRYDSKNWVVTDAGANVLTFSSGRTKTTDNKADYNAVLVYLNTNGFTEVKPTDQSSVSYSTSQAIVQYFASNNFTCSMHNTPNLALNGGATPEPASYRLQLDCAQLSAFKNNVAAVKPLASAYDASKLTAIVQDPLFSAPTKTQSSATKDYANTSVNVASVKTPSDNSSAEFYQTPDKNWHLFAVAKDPAKIACTDYNTDDLKKAYAGFSCWDTSTNTGSFVEQSQPTFEVVPGSIGG